MTVQCTTLEIICVMALTLQRLSPAFWGNGNMIIVGDSQTSPRATFPEGGGTSVHRLPGNQCEMSHFQLLWEPVTCV